MRSLRRSVTKLMSSVLKMIACHCMKYAGAALSRTRHTLCMPPNGCMAKAITILLLHIRRLEIWHLMTAFHGGCNGTLSCGELVSGYNTSPHSHLASLLRQQRVYAFGLIQQCSTCIHIVLTCRLWWYPPQQA